MSKKYEKTGEIRSPRKDEYFLYENKYALQAYLDFTEYKFPILKEIVVQDVIS